MANLLEQILGTFHQKDKKSAKFPVFSFVAKPLSPPKFATSVIFILIDPW